MLILTGLAGYWIYQSSLPWLSKPILFISLLVLLDFKRPHPDLQRIEYDKGWSLIFDRQTKQYERWQLVLNTPWAYLLRFQSSTDRDRLLMIFKDQITESQWRDWIFFSHQLRY